MTGRQIISQHGEEWTSYACMNDPATRMEIWQSLKVYVGSF